MSAEVSTVRILVVEDDAKIASFVVKGLKQEGYAVDHAADGDTGLTLATTTPYDAAVIDIDRSRLPSRETVETSTGAQFANALRHIPSHPEFNPSFRQLLHVSFKLAAKKGDGYLSLLKLNEEIVAKNVTENLYERHLRPLFVG